MIQVCCRVKDCEFPITDAEHVDDGVYILQQHYRMIHPTKAFQTVEQANRVELYNQDLDEVLTAYYGDRWNQPASASDIVSHCRRYILADLKHERFCKKTFEEAEKFIADNPLDAGQQAVQNANAAMAGDQDIPFEDADYIPVPAPGNVHDAPLWRPNPRRLRGR